MDDSVYWFRQAAATGQDWYDYLRLAVSYTDLGALGATRWASERLEVESSLPGAGTAMWLLFSEQWDELARFAVEHLEAGGEPWFWRELAAYSAVLTGSYSRALDLFRADYPELFEATPHLVPGRPTAPLWIAFCYQRQGDPERAEALIRLVLAAVRPTEHGYDRVYSKSYRAVAYALLGQDQQALTEFRKAIEWGPQGPSVRQCGPIRASPVPQWPTGKRDFSSPDG